MSYLYNLFSWWWAHDYSKHVEYRNKHIRKRTVHQVGYLQVGKNLTCVRTILRSRNAIIVLQSLLLLFLLLLHFLSQRYRNRYINRRNILQVQSDTKKTGNFEKPNKNCINPKKKNIARNWTITTCLLRDSNPDYQCLKITSFRWRPPPRMHSFTATTHFKSSRFCVTLYLSSRGQLYTMAIISSRVS
jgi:hypothetical protein